MSSQRCHHLFGGAQLCTALDLLELAGTAVSSMEQLLTTQAIHVPRLTTQVITRYQDLGTYAQHSVYSTVL